MLASVRRGSGCRSVEALCLDLDAADVVAMPCVATVLRARIRPLIRSKRLMAAHPKAVAGAL